MRNMTDELLVDTYFEAIKLNLHPYFINLLKAEIRRRSLMCKINETQHIKQAL